MNNEAVIVFLILCIVLLIGAVIGQKAVLQARINRVLSRTVSYTHLTLPTTSRV